MRKGDTLLLQDAGYSTCLNGHEQPLENAVSAKRWMTRCCFIIMRENAVSVIHAEAKSGNLVIHFVNERVCPKCSGPVIRVHRRLIDRLVSMITLAHRYRCREHGLGCDWEGNLP